MTLFGQIDVVLGRERGARHPVSNSAPFNTNRSEKPDFDMR